MGETNNLSSNYQTLDSFLTFLGREKEKNLSEIASQREAVTEAQKAALASNGTTMEQGVAMALLGALPVLIGLAARGKRGASMGGEAGTGAVGFYAKGLAEEEDRKRKIKLLEAQEAQDLLKQELARQSKLEGLGLSHLSKDILKQKYPSKSPTINIDLGQKPTEGITEEIGTMQASNRKISQILNHIEENFKEKLEKGESSLEAIYRKGEGFVLPEGPQKTLQSMLAGLRATVVNDLVKGNPSYQENKMILDMIEGAGPTANIRFLHENLSRLKDNVATDLGIKMQTAQKLGWNLSGLSVTGGRDVTDIRPASETGKFFSFSSEKQVQELIKNAVPGEAYVIQGPNGKQYTMRVTKDRGVLWEPGNTVQAPAF